MNSVTLSFNFFDNAAITLLSDDTSFLNDICRYYSNYISNQQSENQLTFKRMPNNKLFVYSTFYNINPKVYQDQYKLKLVTDIVEDYLQGIAYKSIPDNRVILHASSIIMERCPILLMGATHSGKSTAVLKLLHHFHTAQYWTDDLAVMDTMNGSLVLQPFSMPLHIRVNSLPYNTLYSCESLGDKIYYVAQSNLGISSLSTVSVPNLERYPVFVIVNLQYTNENQCEEVVGLKKISLFLPNMKYYTTNAVKSCMSVIGKIQLFSLRYCDDDYLFSQIQKIYHLRSRPSQQSLVSMAITAKIQQKYKENQEFYVSVQGESMMPALRHNQKVKVIPITRKEDITKGTIILFHKFKHYTIHRVVDIKKSRDQIHFITKGDGNEVVDSYTVEPNEIIGRVCSDDEG